MRFLFLVVNLLFISHANEIIREDSLPRKYWQYMIGYKYEYTNPNCNVGWDYRKSSFILEGQECSSLKSNIIIKDAITSIDFLIKKMGEHNDFSDYYQAIADGSLNKIKQNPPQSYPKLSSQNYSADYIHMRGVGISVWIYGCADYAAGLSTRTNHSETYNGNLIANRFPNMNPHMIKHIYDEGWKYSERINFMCDTYAHYFVDQYLSIVQDLRK